MCVKHLLLDAQLNSKTGANTYDRFCDQFIIFFR